MANDIQYELIENSERKQFEFHIGDALARIEYIKAQDNIYLTHTEVPKKLEGKGIASQLVQQVLLKIEQSGLTLVPLCPFVAMYIKRHPEWQRILKKGINIA